MEIPLPHNFIPRHYQKPAFNAIEDGIKRACLVWHRRAGKDKTALNVTITEMHKRVGAYYYFFPTFAQGRKIIWDGIDKDGFRYIDHFPKELIDGKPNNTEMKIRLKNGSLFQIVGTDNYDAVVGTNPVGLIFSEYALQDPDAWDYFKPIVAENKGWAIFLYTPRGQNHGFQLHQMAKENDQWLSQYLTVDDTKRDDGTPVISDEDIENERKDGMNEDLIQQEFYCSFEYIGGQAFNFSKKYHVIDPIPIPEFVPIYMTFDWGYGKPFSVGWWWPDSDGRIYRFAEWYGWNKIPNEGIRLTDPEIAQGIIAKEESLTIRNRVFERYAGPDCFQKKPDYKGGGQGPSTAEVFALPQYRLKLRPGDPSRILKLRQFRRRLFVPEDGTAPMMQVYKACTEFIRTMPLIPVDKNNIEDVDTTCEDHIYDEACHICMARPMGLTDDKLKELVKEKEKEAKVAKLDDASRAAWQEKDKLQAELEEQWEWEQEGGVH